MVGDVWKIPYQERAEEATNWAKKHRVPPAADAYQFASALVATQEDPNRLAMGCFDQHLKDAATKEGFAVNP